MSIYHWFILVLGVASAALLTAAAQPAAPKPFTNLGVEPFEKLRAQTNNVVLDVRTAKEFQAGHVPGAIHIDIGAADFEAQAAKLDKSRNYLVYCAGGRRSVTACNRLAPLKFEHLYNLEGGYRSWEKAGHKGVRP